MTPLSSAPFLVVFTGWCAGLSISSRVSPVVVSLVGTLFSAAFLLICTRRFPSGSEVYFPVILLMVFVPLFFLAIRLESPYTGERVFEGEARVVTERSWGGKRAVVLATREGRLLCLMGPEIPVVEGLKLRVAGRVVELEALFRQENRNDFDPPRYWRGKGVQKGFRQNRIGFLETPGMQEVSWRTSLRRKLLLSLMPLVRGHLLAAWTGEKDPGVAGMHQRWGTAHLLAVSGFHVGILAAMILWCLNRFRFKLLWGSALLWGYVFLTGSAASACRAMAMIQLALLGPIVAGRPSSAINSVSVAGGALLLLNPWLFWDTGWRLSVVSALTLCSMAGRRPDSRHVAGAGFAIWLATAGEASRVFGAVPVAGLVLNLFALPFFSFLLPVASIAVLPVLAGVPGGWVPMLGVESLFEVWAGFADLVCRVLPWQVCYSPLLWNLSAGVIGGAVGYGLGIGWRRVLLLFLLSSSCCFVFH
ncbi:MAG: ComEC/Rec2 family competence protein [Synergistales bacterium]